MAFYTNSNTTVEKHHAGIFIYKPTRPTECLLSGTGSPVLSGHVGRTELTLSTQLHHQCPFILFKYYFKDSSEKQVN
jgi:hypothetical protein